MAKDVLSASDKFTESETGKKKSPVILRVDETIKVLFDSDNKLLVDFINSALGVEHDPNTAKVTKLKMEFIDAKTYEKIIADFIVEIEEHSYYIEFQTLPDSTMFIRILEYGFPLVIEQLKEDTRNGRLPHRMDIEWPSPLVIYLEEHSSIPTSYQGTFKIKGSKMPAHYFDVPVIRLWDLDINDLLQRKMYFLLPYILIRYRKQLKNKTTRESAKPEYKQKYKETLSAINALRNKKLIPYETYQALAYTTAHLAAYLNEKFEKDKEFQKEVLTMLEYGSGLLAEAEARGEARGEAKGKLKGKIEMCISELNLTSKQIATKLKISEEQVLQTIRELRL